jgi:hypothetical protein
LDGTRDDVDYARLANDYLVDALLCEAAAYLQNGRDEDGNVSRLERSYYMDAGFMSISDDEEAREYLKKQREIDGDDFHLALYVIENAALIERAARSHKWRILELKAVIRMFNTFMTEF